MRWQRFAVFTAILMAMSGCGHKSSNPVALSQPGDNLLTCEQLDSQMAANREAANKLAGLDSQRESTNTAAVVTSAIIFWPAVFAVDLSNKEQIEMRALRDRNQNLARLHKKSGCDPQ